MIREVDTVILGAGLAGLSAAYHGGGEVFEKDKSFAGTCGSLRSSDGFIFDLGIHALHTKNKYILGLLSRDKKLLLENKRRQAWIYSYGVLTKYPFQANTFGLPVKIIKECLAGFTRAIAKKQENYGNYEDWIYGVFGKGIAKNFYLPYSKKFWTLSADELTTDWLDVRVPRPQLQQVIRGAVSLQEEEFGPNAVFRYPRYGGIQGIAEALLKKGTVVNLGKEAVRVEADKKTVYFKDRTAVRYNKLISTIPLPELVGIITASPLRARQAAQDLKHNSVFCINLGIKRQGLSPKHWIYYPKLDSPAFRISFPGNFSQFTVPKGWSSIQAEVSYSKFRPLVRDSIVERVIRSLIKTNILKVKDKIKLISTRDIKYAYCIYDHNRCRNLKAINNFLEKHNILSAGRYGKWEYLWMDEAILSGGEAASGNRRIKKA